MAFIRPYKPSDWEDTAHICRATLPPSIINVEQAIRLAPYLWTHQYTLLNPQNCFVLDDGQGRAVGYVIGAADVHAMAAKYDLYTDLLKGSEGPEEAAKKAEAAGLSVLPEAVAQFRKDVLPPPAQLEPLEPWHIDAPGGAPGEKVVNETCLKQQVFSAKWVLLASPHTEAKAKLVTETPYRAVMHIDLLPSHQASGWGRQMIQRFLRSIAAEGARGLQIGVSGENTKVVPFYEKCGFRVLPGGEVEGNVWMVRDVGPEGQ